jgi:hypothetical protein
MFREKNNPKCIPTLPYAQNLVGQFAQKLLGQIRIGK